MAELSHENFERQVYSGDYKALDFLSKLAALVPRPRHNLVRYHGVFAPNSKVRKLIVPKSRKTVKRKEDSKTHKSVEELASQDELIDPESNGFITDGNIALGQQVFHISNTQIEPIVEPNGILNDRRWESMAFIDVFHSGMLPDRRLTCQYPLCLLYSGYSTRGAPYKWC